MGNRTIGAEGKVRRLMVARMQHVKGNKYKDGQEYTQATSEPVPEIPRVNYYHKRMEPDPCPDPSLLDSLDDSLELDAGNAVKKMVQQARDKGLPKNESELLCKMVEEHIDMLRVSFYHGPPALIRPLRIELGLDAFPVKVRLRNYSKD